MSNYEELARDAKAWDAGYRAMLKRWREDAIIALRVTAMVTVLVYGPIWFYEGLIKAVYTDHVSLVQQVKSIPGKDEEIKTLKAKLVDTCYLPDRRLTQEQHDVLYLRLKNAADNTPQKARRVILGFFKGDSESQRYARSLHEVFSNAGFNVGGQPITRPRWEKPGDMDNWGVDYGITISYNADNIAEANKLQHQVVSHIEIAFRDAKIPIAMDWALHESDKRQVAHPILWIGLKENAQGK